MMVQTVRSRSLTQKLELGWVTGTGGGEAYSPGNERHS